MNYPYLQNIPDGKIKSLNGLRFIMIMFIVLTHINYLEEFFPNYFLGRGAAFGVDYFFMLSGFGMMLSAIKKTFPENTRITPGTCINYAVSHIRKIYPQGKRIIDSAKRKADIFRFLNRVSVCCLL